MKKVLSGLLAIILIMMLGAIPAVAASPPFNGSVSGVITSDDDGAITGTLSGDYNLTVTGQIIGTSEPIPFSGTVSGDINGTITGAMNTSGIDTMAAEITGTGATGTVRIIGMFPQSGVHGDFAGEIITETTPPVLVQSMSIGTQSGEDTVTAGSTLQMTVQTEPAEASGDVAWSIHVDDRDKAAIDQNGVVTGLQAGPATVIAKALDGSLQFAQKTLNVVNPQTEVTGGVDPSYIIVIPAAVDFGTMVKGSGIISQEFLVEAQSVVLEDGNQIKISVSSNFIMSDKEGGGDISLAYSLSNSVPVQMTSGATFTLFAEDRIETGEISVNTDNITKAGIYKGTMNFLIVYE